MLHARRLVLRHLRDFSGLVRPSCTASATGKAPDTKLDVGGFGCAYGPQTTSAGYF